MNTFISSLGGQYLIVGGHLHRPDETLREAGVRDDAVVEVVRLQKARARRQREGGSEECGGRCGREELTTEGAA